MLNISHFSKTYPGGKRAVEDLSLAVPAGQIVGFIGHNGAGKTTTLRCAAGILDFSEGTIEIDGHDIRREPVAAKQVTAFLPDNPDLYEFMTGVQYLTFIADIYGIPAGERTRRVQEYAGAFEPFVGLDPQAAIVMKGYLRQVCSEGGSVLFSTHVLEVAQKLCDRIAIIKAGRLVEEGPTADIVGKSDLEAVFLELAREGEGHA